MIKFFLAGIIALAFCTLFLTQNSFTSLVHTTQITTSPNDPSHIKDNNEDTTKTTLNTITNSPQQAGETSSNKAYNTNTSDEKRSGHNFEQNPRDTNNKQQKEFPQQPSEKLEKDIVQDIKTPHGESVVKKVKDEKSVTILTTEDKRITGLQMPKGLEPAIEKLYMDDKNSKAETGIQLPHGKQHPVSSQSYVPDRTEPRY